MGDIIDIKSFKKKRSILTLPFTEKKQITIDVNELDFDKENYKSCATCLHYKHEKVHGRRCMVYPSADFHHITTEVCNPYNDKELWYPSNTRKHEVGIIRRFLRFIF